MKGTGRASKRAPRGGGISASRASPPAAGAQPGQVPEDLRSRLERLEKENAELRTKLSSFDPIAIRKENAELQTKLSSFDPITIRQLLSHLPALQSNDDAVPSESVERKAKIKTDRGFVKKSDVTDCPVNYLGEDGSLLPSSLLVELGDASTLSYQNEATVQRYVHSLICDALKSLGCASAVEVYSEMSIFSLRPDLIVVKHPNLGVVLVVEVKNPGQRVFTSEHIGGQVYDYLMGMRRLGHSTPFVVLCSYEEMVIARLGGEVSMKSEYRNVVEACLEELIKEEGKYRGDIGTCTGEKQGISPQRKFAIAELGGDGRCAREGGGITTMIPKTPTEPEPEDDKKGNDSKVENEDQDQEPEPSSVVHYSTIFRGVNVFKAMILAITCGIRSLDTVDQTAKNLPSHNDDLDTEMPFVTKTNFKWKICSRPLNYDKCPPKSCQGLYLIDELGRGKSGKVFLACDGDGNSCAVKFFLDNPQDWKSFHGKDRDRKRKSKQKKVVEAEAELQRWKRFSRFRNCTACFELNHQVVLKMPYFAPIPEDQRGDDDILEQVRRELEKFRNDGLGYDEVQWRHVGCSFDANDKIAVTMLDLGSLKKNPKKTIDGNIEELERRSGSSVAVATHKSVKRRKTAST